MNAVVIFRGFQYHYLHDGQHGPGWYTYVNGCVRVKGGRPSDSEGTTGVVGTRRLRLARHPTNRIRLVSPEGTL